MPFMVIYSTSDGTSCHEQADAIDEAALFVERLRNQDGIEEVRLYRMEEISFAFRPYYKVELGMPERFLTSSPSAEVLSVPEAPIAGPTIELDGLADVQPAPSAELSLAAPTGASPLDDGDASGANGRRGLFGR